MKGKRKTFRIGDEVLVRPMSYQEWYKTVFKKPITMEIHAYVLDVFVINYISKAGIAYLKHTSKLMLMCPLAHLDHYEEEFI